MRISKDERIARAKRLKEWKGWLNSFKISSQQMGIRLKFTYVPRAAEMLNDLYWHLAEEYIRPILKQDENSSEKHRIHPYKIIAASEIAIMMTEPIIVKTEVNEEKLINACFAWFVATQIVENWDTGSLIKIKNVQIETIATFTENIDKRKKYPVSFSVEHIQWLTLLNVTVEKPLLLLAQCWRLFFISCMSVASKGNLNK